MKTLILSAAVLVGACLSQPETPTDASETVAADTTENSTARWLEGDWQCVVQYLAVAGFPGSTAHATTAQWSWLFTDDLHPHSGWQEAGASPFSFSDAWSLTPPDAAGALDGTYGRQASDGTFVGATGFIGSFGAHLDGAWNLPLRFGAPIYWNMDVVTAFPPNGQLSGSFRVSVNRGALANYANFNCVQSMPAAASPSRPVDTVALASGGGAHGNFQTGPCDPFEDPDCTDSTGGSGGGGGGGGGAGSGGGGGSQPVCPSGPPSAMACFSQICDDTPAGKLACVGVCGSANASCGWNHTCTWQTDTPGCR